MYTNRPGDFQVDNELNYNSKKQKALTTMTPISWNELIVKSVTRLEAAGIEDAVCEVEYLVMHVFDIRRIDLVLSKCDPIPESKFSKLSEYEELLSMRIRRIPLSQVIGEREFMGLTFKVNQNVLTPRFETEELVELVLHYTEGADVLDLCTGSGCIALSIAKLGNPKSVAASDLSDEALLVARENAEHLGFDVDSSSDLPALKLIKSNLFENIPGRFDIIVSNPPYIASGEIETLDPEVKDNEPRMALDGGKDGLYFYRKIIDEVGKHLNKNGRVFFEIGYNQGSALHTLLTDAGFGDVSVRKDLSGRDRIATGILK